MAGALDHFNIQHRSSIMKAMAESPFDLLVIGGGITGASITRDAAQRGLKVGLVEARDFASGTSSRSSKLIHGGLRYIKQLGFRLAWESCHERDMHVSLNRRLVKPAPFLIPLYEGASPGRISMRLGMMLYETLAGFRNHRFHRFLPREETLMLAPGIPTDKLTGSVVYFDALVNDNRWTIEIVKDAIRHGGVALNHCPVTRLLKHDARIVGAMVKDSLSPQEFEVRAKVVVNATGVWCDGIRRLDDADCRPLVKLSRGTHLVFREEDIPVAISTVLKSSLDGRPLFLVRRDGSVLLGTTDDWSEQSADTPEPQARDVEYLVASLEAFMPECRPVADKVRFVYSGFRPLLRGDGRANPSESTRDDLIETSAAGLVSVVGGKLTTARVMAKKVLRRVEARLPKSTTRGRCLTGRTSIGGDNVEVAEGYAHWVKQCPQLTDYFRVLFERYGVEAAGICPEAAQIASGLHPDPAAEPIRAEVKYVCRHEMACSIEDLVERRAGFLHWDKKTRLDQARRGAHIIQTELGLTAQQFESQMTAYEHHLRRFHTLP